jgi:hypothetical protein
MKRKKIDKRTRAQTTVKKTATCKKIVYWDRVMMGQPSYLLNDLAD